MTSSAPTIELIHAQVEAIPERSRKGKAIGIHSIAPWQEAVAVSNAGCDFQVYQCESPLEARNALREPLSSNATRVLVTPLDTAEIGSDVCQRLAKRRLFALDTWSIVRDRYKAKEIDPRLIAHPQIAEHLLSGNGAGVGVARAGFLDADVVWPLVLRETFGLPSADLERILLWTLDPASRDLFVASETGFRAAAVEWLCRSVGPAVGLVASSLMKAQLHNPVSLGVVAGVLYDPGLGGAADRAVGRFEERFLSGESPDRVAATSWSAASERVLESLLRDADRDAAAIQSGVDELLMELGVQQHAHLSRLSRLGFEQRVAAYGSELGRIVQVEEWQDTSKLTAAESLIQDHFLAASNPRRVERVKMASRLVRWFASDAAITDYASLAEAADEHLRSDGFADWARMKLRHRDTSPEFERGISSLAEAARAVREDQASSFASQLVKWQKSPPRLSDALPVEAVLEAIVAPLALSQSLLLVVLDGQNAAVSAELLESVRTAGWRELTESGRDTTRAAIATIPSKTDCSRTSLLCGRLAVGTASDERRGFESHPCLIRAGGGRPPRLFHKSGLRRTEDETDALDAVADTTNHIVGVVINAIDDTLAKHDQLDDTWDQDAVAVLRPLLECARRAGRLVIITSDHGHLLDSGSDSRASELGQRFRSAERPPQTGEMLIDGPRVMPDGAPMVVAVNERIHYGQRAHGYHGGLNPQEMVVPITVLTSAAKTPSGWEDRIAFTPDWWEPTSQRSDAPTVEQETLESRPVGKGLLFNLHEEQAPIRETAPPHPEAIWVEQLIQSEAYQSQKALGGRHLPDDEVIVKLLSALHRSGGKLTHAALARALAFPQIRLPGLLAKVERVLNIDGYDALRRDDASSTIELDLPLLRQQFELGSDAE